MCQTFRHTAARWIQAVRLATIWHIAQSDFQAVSALRRGYTAACRTAADVSP